MHKIILFTDLMRSQDSRIENPWGYINITTYLTNEQPARAVRAVVIRRPGGRGFEAHTGWGTLAERRQGRRVVISLGGPAVESAASDAAGQVTVGVRVAALQLFWRMEVVGRVWINGGRLKDSYSQCK